MMPQARDTAASSLPLAAQTQPSQETAPPLLQMQGIVKRYGSTVALAGVNLEVRAGEIHALLGENGAGKSTLMHVLSGLTRSDAGKISIEGREVHIGSPRDARKFGIAMVHQHFTLVPAFSVEENLALDAPRPRFHLRYLTAAAAAPALDRSASLGWHLEPKARVSDLPVGVQQRVEIVKALATGARLVIFDEPTAVLAEDEVEDLFKVLRLLRDEGNAIILIAHKLAEILAVADRVTVLRRGHNVGDCPVAETDARKLAEWMIGQQELPLEERVSSTRQGKPPVAAEDHAFQVREISVEGYRGETALAGVSFGVSRGEIFGIGGVDGNGQTELAEALTGLRRLKSGTLQWENGPYSPGKHPRIGYIPQDRRRAGLAVGLSIEENLLFEAVQDARFHAGPLLRHSELRKLARRLVSEFDIRTADPKLPASSLSGGNQQKIVVARALNARPDLIIAVNPTRGLDIGATRFMHEQLVNARRRGAAVVLISTDLDELAALADRGAVLSGGRLSAASFERRDAGQLGLLFGGIQATAAEASAEP